MAPPYPDENRMSITYSERFVGGGRSRCRVLWPAAPDTRRVPAPPTIRTQASFALELCGGRRRRRPTFVDAADHSQTSRVLARLRGHRVRMLGVCESGWRD